MSSENFRRDWEFIDQMWPDLKILLSHHKDSELRIVKWEDLNGSRCAVLESIRKNFTQHIGYKAVRFWVDPDRGFTVPRVQIWCTDNDDKLTELSIERDAVVRPCGKGLCARSSMR